MYCMRFGDFTDYRFIIFFVTLIIIGVLLALVVTFYAIGESNERKFKKQISYESTTTRIFIIDVKKNRYVVFNKSDISNKKTADLFSFYSSFHPNDVERVKSWIFDICVSPDNVNEYLEADVLINKTNKVCT